MLIDLIFNRCIILYHYLFFLECRHFALQTQITFASIFHFIRSEFPEITQFNIFHILPTV